MDFIRSFITSYLPPNYSEHGHHIDNLIVWTHYLMFALFLGWGIYFVYVLIKFRSPNVEKANYKGVTSHYSSYAEGGVILFEAFLIFALALPKWQDLKINIDKPVNQPVSASVIDLRNTFLEFEGVEQDDITTFFPENEVVQDKQVIHIIAQAFNYNVHYPGPDGKFGPRHKYLVNDGEAEYIGLDWNHPDSKDDIVLMDELILEVDKPVLIYLTSKDVIHSFYLPEFRVKQDAIPGQRVAIFFKPEITTKEFLENNALEFHSSFTETNTTTGCFEMFDIEQTIIDSDDQLNFKLSDNIHLYKIENQNYTLNTNYKNKLSCEDNVGFKWMTHSEKVKPDIKLFSLWDWISDPENYDYEYLDFNNDGSSINYSSQRGELLPETYGRDTFQMGCAQLCGSGNSAMAKGDVFIVSPEEYQQWYFGQMWAKNSIIIDEEEDWGDDW